MTDTHTDSPLVSRGIGMNNHAIEFYRVKLGDEIIEGVEVYRWPSARPYGDCLDDGAKLYPADGRWERVTGPGTTEIMPEGFEPWWIWSLCAANVCWDFDTRWEVEKAVNVAARMFVVVARSQDPTSLCDLCGREGFGTHGANADHGTCGNRVDPGSTPCPGTLRPISNKSLVDA